MRSYYRGKRAVCYNQTWKRFSEKTLAMTCSTIDFKQLQGDAGAREGPLRVLDVACGTGLLLQSLVSHLPHVELYGVDESQEMLDQARLLL
ncbi:MAG: methyltransferase domain-containing protein, partial [Ktedonobacteraceae bacterium]|nr:methyltransferase domain-containing protein [Ktedonobacteraceae bacterium]